MKEAKVSGTEMMLLNQLKKCQLVISILEKEKKTRGFSIVITNYIFLDTFCLKHLVKN